jgi:hypothetical protein
MSNVGDAMITFLHNLGANKIMEDTQNLFKDKENKQKKVNILQLILDQNHLLWKKATDKDIESYYYIIAFLLKELGSSSIDLFLPTLVDSVISETHDRINLRLSLLKGIYNWFPDINYSKNELYHKVFFYALQTKLCNIVIPELENIEKVVDDFNFTTEKKREIFALSIKIYLEAKSQSDYHQNIITLIHSYFKTFDSDESVTDLGKHMENIRIFFYTSLKIIFFRSDLLFNIQIDF